MKKKRTSSLPIPKIFICGDSQLAEEIAEIVRKKKLSVLDPNDFPSLQHSKHTVAAAIEATNLDHAQKKKNLIALDAAMPPTVPIISSSITLTALEQSQWLQHRERFIGFGGLPSVIQNSLVELAPTLSTQEGTTTAARQFFESIGKETVLVQDRIGMVFPRILCQIINEAFLAAQDGVASPGDIDRAMMLAASYPDGPIAWGEKIGFPTVAAVLEALAADLRDDRYRIVPLLKQLSMAGKFWGKSSAAVTSSERPTTPHKRDLHTRQDRTTAKKKKAKR